MNEKERKSGSAGLASESKTASRMLWTYIVGIAIWIYEQIVERIMKLSLPHNLDRCHTRVLNFKDGFLNLLFQD